MDRAGLVPASHRVAAGLWARWWWPSAPVVHDSFGRVTVTQRLVSPPNARTAYDWVAGDAASAASVASGSAIVAGYALRQALPQLQLLLLLLLFNLYWCLTATLQRVPQAMREAEARSRSLLSRGPFGTSCVAIGNR